MTEYWQSQAKKFCDFCKCWLTDNKPSIEFHERGKKHKENVERKIKEVRKRGTQVIRDKDELKKNLEAIEAAALEAYKKDVGEDAFAKATNDAADTKPGLAYRKPMYDRTVPIPGTTTGMATSSEGCSIIYNDGQPVVHCRHHWSISQTPEGYYYYYNSQTQASKWDVPDCLQTQENDTTEQTSKQENIEGNSTENKSDEMKDDKEATKESEPEKDEGESEPPTTFKSYSPYGAWTTVRTIEPPTKCISEGIDKEAACKGDEEAMEDPEVTAKKTEKKFKERKTPKIAFHKTVDEVVTFKKRKLNSEKKRNVRQTKFDS